MKDFAGRIPAQIGYDAFSQPIVGEISSLGNSNNFYEFFLKGSSSLNLSLVTQSGDLGLQIIHDQNQNQQVDGGEVISSQLIPTNSEFQGHLNLQAGNYFVRVFNEFDRSELASGEQRSLQQPATYILNLQQQEAGSATTDLAGNDFDTARVINTAGRTGVSTYSDWVGTGANPDRMDMYKFTLDKSAIAKLKLTGLTGDVDLRLYNSLGNEIDMSALIGQGQEGLTKWLTSGTYYIAVEAPGNLVSNPPTDTDYDPTIREGSQYNLEFATIDYNEPGSNAVTAQNLPILLLPTSDPSLLRGSINLRDVIGLGDRDTWKLDTNFNPGASISISSPNINLRNINTVSLDFQLFQDRNGNLQLDANEEIQPTRFDYNSFFATWDFTNLGDRSLGDYYIQASSNTTNSFDYSFSISINQTIAPQSLSIPLEVKSDSSFMGGTKTFTGSVSNRKSNFWQINSPLTSNSRLSINTTALNLQNANSTSFELTLFQDTNNNYLIDVGEVIPVTKADYNSIFASWEFSDMARPQAGNYYLVASSQADVILNYSLNVTWDEILTVAI